MGQTASPVSCVHRGIGKDWAKGLTAATDARIARAVAAHRGRRYRTRSRAESIEWTVELAYALGLLATDGCLSGDGRHIAFVSADEEVVRTLLACVGRPNLRYVRTSSRIGTPVYRASVSHVALYAWLQARGLTARKSLTLGALDVPPYLLHVVRGLLDGDGSIYLRRQRPTRRTYPGYVYTRLWTYFSSASAAHILWLRVSLESALGIRGWVERTSRLGRRPFYRLRFGRRDSLALLGQRYADPDWPALERKRAKWASVEGEIARGAEGGLRAQEIGDT